MVSLSQRAAGSTWRMGWF